MTGKIAYIEPPATRNPERRTGNINADNGTFCTFPISQLVNPPEVIDGSLVGRRCVFNIEHQSDAVKVRLLD